MKNIVFRTLLIMALIALGISAAYANTIKSYTNQPSPTGTDAYLVQEGSTYYYENLSDILGYISGDCTIASTGVITCTKSSGTTLAAIAKSGSATDLAAGITSPARGGTGVSNNSASTITISGNYGATFTLSGATGVTFPTSGTLVTTGVSILSSLVQTGTLTAGGLGAGYTITNVDSPSFTGKLTAAAISASGAIVASTSTADINPAFSTSILGNPVIKYLSGTATVSQINSGITILTGVTSRIIYVSNFDVVATGTPGTCTGVYLEDTNGSPVIVGTMLVGALTSGTHDFATTANVGAGFGAAGLTSGKGLQLKVDGSNCVTMTSMSYSITYSVQ